MRTLVTALLLALAPLAVEAQPASDVVKLELLPGWRQADGTHVAGLRISMAPGWKTYWRAPGEAGIPPSFDWSGSRNVASATPHFPVPDVFSIGGIRTIGYKDSVVLPIALQPSRPGEPISLRANVELGVCESVCIPIRAQITATLNAGSTDGATEIRKALADAPMSPSRAGLRGIDCRIEPISDGLRLTATFRMPAFGSEEAAVIELGDPKIWVSEVEARRDGGRLTAAADLVPPSGAPFALDRSSLRFTVLAGGRAVEMNGCG